MSKVGEENVPQHLEYGVLLGRTEETEDHSEDYVVTKFAPGKWPWKLTVDELRAISDEHLRDIIPAVEYLEHQGLSTNGGRDCLYDPTEGLTIVEYIDPEFYGISCPSASEQYLDVVRSITSRASNQGVEERSAIEDLRARALEVYSQNWHSASIPAYMS